MTLAFNVDNGGDPDLLLESRLAVDNLSISAVPEPSAPALLGLGLLTLIGVQRVRRAKQLSAT
ncbi:MAG: PEP-CTERM sorting domain-containing protein [Verrucomicrobiota bacterium]